jgi:ABC-type multidrug transport system ATPase subunit
MSERILKALMQLFAICANTDKISIDTRRIVESFLKQNLSLKLVESYLELFQDNVSKLSGSKDENKQRKKVSLNSVKVLRICNDINKELDAKQKYIVLIRLIEFLYSINSDIDTQEKDFLDTVSSTFNINESDYFNLILFLSAKYDSIPQEYIRKYSKVFSSLQHSHTISQDSNHELIFFHTTDADLILLKSILVDDLSFNNQFVNNDVAQIVHPGSVIRSGRFKTIYFSEIQKLFKHNDAVTDISLSASNIEYVFDDGSLGIRDFSFTQSSRGLVGIMGNSGAGKSTLLNILNGSLLPSKGTLMIEDLNLHQQKDKVLPYIGYIPQDDLLIAELSVYENLYYSAKLSIGKLEDSLIKKKIDKTLRDLGLYEIRHVKVGDSLNKFISGGQRKRLNIALELIREPKVLYVDEPTSGLSSSDSENVMDLLREIADNGSIVMVVIHQPSSQIFKLFDKLIILDKGGFHIYAGNPLDAINYFKKQAGFADFNLSECVSCGNVNPEIIFSIVESHVIDEYGNVTANRKVTASEWNKLYKEQISQSLKEESSIVNKRIEDKSKTKPGVLFQFSIYLKRDIISKLKNSQYLFINLLIAPVLAFILAITLRYQDINSAYNYGSNNNITVFLFISVIVAFFLGLSISAEEIIKDKKILKREELLQLNRHSYLLSKISVLSFISLFQITCYTLIAYFILDLNSLLYTHLILLLTSLCALLIGLNLSSGFRNAITVYILIPFVVIPQMLLCGVMVRFDKLNSIITSNKTIPAIGNSMISRWSFEALAINEFLSNDYNKKIYNLDSRLSNSKYMVDEWSVFMNDSLKSSSKSLIQNELKSKANLYKINAVQLDSSNTKNIIESIKEKEIDISNNFEAKKSALLISDTNLYHIKKQRYNNTLADLLKNKEGFDKLSICNNEVIRLYEPIYNQTPTTGLSNSPLYSYSKNFYGKIILTTVANIYVLIGIILALYVILYFNILEIILLGLEKISSKLLRR